MKNHKAKMLSAILICIVVIAVVCRVVFSAKSVADIVSISKVDSSSVSITVFKGEAGENFNQVFRSEDAGDLEKIVEILSPAKAHLVEWNPLTGIVPAFDEDDVYAIMIDDAFDFKFSFDYSDGYIYYNYGKYRLSSGDVEPLVKGLEALCSEYKQKNIQ